MLIFVAVWVLYNKSNSSKNKLEQINKRYLEIEKKYEPQKQQRINEMIKKTLEHTQQGNNVDKVN